LNLKEATIHVEGKFAFLVGASPDWSTGYLVILDVGDPSDPQEVGILDLGEYATDIYVLDNNAYVIQHHGGLKIINTDNPSKPAEVGFCQALRWGNGVFVQGNNAYVVGALGGGWAAGPPRLCIISIDDPCKPMVYGICDGDVGIYSNVFVSGDHAYVAGYWSSGEGTFYGSWLDIIDITYPPWPTRVGRYDSFPERPHVADIHVSDKHIYCATDNGLEILDATDPSDVQRVAQFSTIAGRVVSVTDKLIFLLAQDGLYVLQSNFLTAIVQEGASPTAFSLSQNYPNPFNPSTTIEFALPHAGFATLKVYSILGEEVATLVSEQRDAGTFKTTWDASGIPSGVYLYRLTAGEFVQTKRMMLIK
jgi:hypothetical protein